MIRPFALAVTLLSLCVQPAGHCHAQALTSGPVERAMILAGMGDAFNAEALAARAVQENPMDAAAHAFLARFYLANPSYETTLERMDIADNVATPSYKQYDGHAVRGAVHMKCLSQMGEAGLDELAVLLRDKNPKVAEQAAAAVGMSGSHRRVRILAGTLENVHTPSVAAAVLRALGSTNSTEAYTLLSARLAALRRSGGTGGFVRSIEQTLALLPNPAGTDELRARVLSGTREEAASAARGLLCRTDVDGVKMLLDMALQPAPFPEAAWSVMLDGLRLESAAHVASVCGALRSADPRVVQRALALAARQTDTAPLLDAVVKALDPRFADVSILALQRIGNLDSAASVRGVARLLFDPASNDGLRQEAARTLAATTETLRDVFNDALAGELSATTVPLQSGALVAAALATQDWGGTRPATLLISALERACAEDPGTAKRLEQELRGRVLGPESVALLLGWVEGQPGHRQAHRSALALLAGLPEPEREKLRPWALARIQSDRPDLRQAALAVLNASLAVTGLKPDEEKRLEEMELAVAGNVAEASAGSQAARDAADAHRLVQQILGTSRQLNRRKHSYLD